MMVDALVAANSTTSLITLDVWSYGVRLSMEEETLQKGHLWDHIKTVISSLYTNVKLQDQFKRDYW